MSAATLGEATRNKWFEVHYRRQPPKGSYKMLTDTDRKGWEDIGRAAVEADPDHAALYRERAALVAFLAASYPAVKASPLDADPGEWAIVFVQTPNGQMSWHVAVADMDLFAHVPQDDAAAAAWDGHTTPEKYQRLAELTHTVATGIYGPQPGSDQ